MEVDLAEEVDSAVEEDMAEVVDMAVEFLIPSY